MKFGIAQSATRKEDTRFLKGEGRYIDDIAAEGTLRAALLRSPVAHGRITHLDASAARAAPGVKLVFTYDDVRDRLAPLKCRMPVQQADGTPISDILRPNLADGVVRFVGHPDPPVNEPFVDEWARILDAWRNRQGDVGRADGSGHEPPPPVAPVRVLDRLAGQPGRRDVQLAHEVGGAVVGLRDARGREGVGLDDVGAGIAVADMDVAQGVGLGEHQFVQAEEEVWPCPEGLLAADNLEVPKLVRDPRARLTEQGGPLPSSRIQAP